MNNFENPPANFTDHPLEERPPDRTIVDSKPCYDHTLCLNKAYAVSFALLNNKFKIWKNHFFLKKNLVNNPSVFYKTIQRLSKIHYNNVYNHYLEQMELNRMDAKPDFTNDKEIINQYLSEITENKPLKCQFEQLKQQISALECCYCTLPSLTTTLEKFYNRLCDNLYESVYRELNG